MFLSFWHMETYCWCHFDLSDRLFNIHYASARIIYETHVKLEIHIDCTLFMLHEINMYIRNHFQTEQNDFLSVFVSMYVSALPIDTDFIHFICLFREFCGINATVFSSSCTSARYAGGFDCLMSSLIMITMEDGRGHCVWRHSCKVPNQTRRGVENWKMYAIKKIKICAEHQDMLPRPRLDLSGTPGIRPIGLSWSS